MAYGHIERKERYVINGVEYSSLEDVPTEHRALIERPLQGTAGAQTEIDERTATSVTQDFVNGEEITGKLGGIPGAITGRMLEDNDGDGVADVWEPGSLARGSDSCPRPHARFPAPSPVRDTSRVPRAAWALIAQLIGAGVCAVVQSL